MSKLDQIRALRERQFAIAAKPAPIVAGTRKRRKQPAAAPAPPDAAAPFDRVGYQREYMKRWRARKKAKPVGLA